MKKTLMAATAYFAAGIGFYYVFSDNANIYGFIILFMGLTGVFSDVFYKKLNAVKYELLPKVRNKIPLLMKMLSEVEMVV